MFKLPELNYGYEALEPFIDTLTMETHHSKHHQAYVNNLNAALEKYPDYFDKSIEHILTHLSEVPTDIQTAVRNNGGGHYNHSLFWNWLSPKGGGEPTGDLKEAIDATFGSFDAFKAQFKTAAVGRFGSGWAWLVQEGDGKLAIVSTANQDNPISDGKGVLLGLDVWEHAYYLKYTNKRADYIDNWWHLVDWSKVAAVYKK